MGNCDNCGQEVNRLIGKEFTELRFQLGWPPVRRVIVEEMWCPSCRYAHRPESCRVSARKRRKLEFDDDHPHKSE